MAEIVEAGGCGEPGWLDRHLEVAADQVRGIECVPLERDEDELVSEVGSPDVRRLVPPWWSHKA